MALCQHTGIEGFYVAICSSIEDLNKPKIFFSEKVEHFVTDVLNIEPQHLALNLEAWTMSGLAGMFAMNGIKTFAYHDSGSLPHQSSHEIHGMCVVLPERPLIKCHVSWMCKKR